MQDFDAGWRAAKVRKAIRECLGQRGVVGKGHNGFRIAKRDAFSVLVIDGQEQTPTVTQHFIRGDAWDM